MPTIRTTQDMTPFESALTRLKKMVYKQRLRLYEFLADFDKLRSGFVYPNHFMSALSIAGVDKGLSYAEMQIICDTYTVPRSPSLIMTDYRTFLQDVDVVFTLPNLEKTPLADVAPEPWELLDRDRYYKSSRILSDEDEDILRMVIQRMEEIVNKRGTPVKPFFDDAAADDNSVKLYGHVTIAQFRQCISTKLDLHLTDHEAAIVVNKFRHEDKPELVNYIAFSNTIDNPEKYWGDVDDDA
ncbi:flagellar associated protein [Dunaliella salina]|uniref:Flagellar associated protein n=1 Tax=Dunaliella salina TaxID=3046 RepID=A0ABQ7GNC0_DUNSA|nr:flagellar associated protein [Dunaliella salina]|eukprot:KAF5836110.1 flagellar associated protein [Dunaliella salina]